MSHRREDGTFEPLGDETPDERKRRLTGARADALLAVLRDRTGRRRGLTLNDLVSGKAA